MEGLQQVPQNRERFTILRNLFSETYCDFRYKPSRCCPIS